MNNNPYNHEWDFCTMCGPMVECGVCGHNACGGGNGWQIRNGGSAKCPGCDSAHDMMIAETNMPSGPEWEAKRAQWEIDHAAMREESRKSMEEYWASDAGKEERRLWNLENKDGDMALPLPMFLDTKCAMCDKLNGEHEEWCENEPIYYARCLNQAEQDAIEAVLVIVRKMNAKGGCWSRCFTTEQRVHPDYLNNLIEHASDMVSEIIYQNTKK